MTRVSSLSSVPVSVLGPSASAATIRARLVRLFDPGTRTRPWRGGPVQGVIDISSGYARESLISFLGYEQFGRQERDEFLAKFLRSQALDQEPLRAGGLAGEETNL